MGGDVIHLNETDNSGRGALSGVAFAPSPMSRIRESACLYAQVSPMRLSGGMT